MLAAVNLSGFLPRQRDGCPRRRFSNSRAPGSEDAQIDRVQGITVSTCSGPPAGWARRSGDDHAGTVVILLEVQSSPRQPSEDHNARDLLDKEMASEQRAVYRCHGKLQALRQEKGEPSRRYGPGEQGRENNLGLGVGIAPPRLESQIDRPRLKQCPTRR